MTARAVWHARPGALNNALIVESPLTKTMFSARFSVMKERKQL